MNTRQTVILFSLLVLTGTAGTTSAQVISERARQERLSEIAAVVESNDAPIEDALAQCQDPFFPTAGQGSQGTTAGGGTPQNADITPEEQLQQIADILNPTGIMSGGKDRYLVTASGNIYQVGKPFNVRLNGEDFEVTVDDANNRGYILRHEKTRIVRSYLSGNDSGN